MQARFGLCQAFCAQVDAFFMPLAQLGVFAFERCERPLELADTG
jgi:hypothetical protein